MIAELRTACRPAAVLLLGFALFALATHQASDVTGPQDAARPVAQQQELAAQQGSAQQGPGSVTRQRHSSETKGELPFTP